MNSLVFLPNELKINIMEFNPEHRIKFKKCLERIPLETVLFKCQCAAKSYTHNNPHNLQYIIHLNNHIENLEKAVSILNTCNCCKRHSHRKPCNVHDFENVNIPYPTQNKYNCNCECVCRHNARWMCRAAEIFT